MTGQLSTNALSRVDLSYDLRPGTEVAIDLSGVPGASIAQFSFGEIPSTVSFSSVWSKPATRWYEKTRIAMANETRYRLTLALHTDDFDVTLELMPGDRIGAAVAFPGPIARATIVIEEAVEVEPETEQEAEAIESAKWSREFWSSSE